MNGIVTLTSCDNVGDIIEVNNADDSQVETM